MVPKAVHVLLTAIAGLSITLAVIVALSARDIKTAMILVKDMKEYEDKNEE